MDKIFYRFLLYLCLAYLVIATPLKINTNEDFIYQQLKVLDRYLLKMCKIIHIFSDHFTYALDFKDIFFDCYNEPDENE